MKVLVLGGTGFVGKNVTSLLSTNKEIEVASASRKSGTDLRDEAQTLKTIKAFNPDYIVNCAAHVGSLHYVTEKAADVIMDNLKMIINMYNAVAQINKKIIIINPIANCAFPGEANIYKESEWQNGPVHNSVLSYGNAKRFLWATAECFRMQHSIKTINLFVPNMYGPFDSTDPNKAHALNALISKFTKGEASTKKEIIIWGSGKVVREWLFAKDFAQIVAHILKSQDLQQQLSAPINIGQNFGLSITELAAIINNNFGNAFELKYDTTKPDGAPKKVMADELFRSYFPDFKFTDFNLGIKETVTYYKSLMPF